GGTLTVSNSIIDGNTSSGSGTAGGIDNRGTLAVNDSTISSNSGWAGGIWNGGTLTVGNSTISGNAGGLLQSMQTAGGIANVAQNSDATIMLLSATIANNTVSGSNRTGSQLFCGQLGAGMGKAT